MHISVVVKDGKIVGLDEELSRHLTEKAKKILLGGAMHDR